MKTLWHDVRYGLRVLRAGPGFTIVAVLTLAVGIAASTTVFSWIDTVLLRPLPGTGDGSRLVALEVLDPDGEGHNTSYADYRDFRDHLQLVSAIAVTLQPNGLSIGEGDHALRAWGELVSGNYFAVLGVRPLYGRFFLPEEQGDAPGSSPVAVISERLWRSGFQADPGVIGRSVLVNRCALTIVGVAPTEFRGITRGLVFDMWVPLVMGPQLRLFDAGVLDNRKWRPLQGIARLRPGVSVEQARAEVVAVARELARANPETNEGFGATLVPEARAHAGAQSLLRAPLGILMAMSGVVLLIACVNVANLLLARSTVRQKELSIRLALGAAPGRLVRQLLTEAFLLAGVAALAGLPLALWMVRSLSYLAPRTIGLPVGLDLDVKPEAFVFTILVCGAAALLCGVSPALHAIGADVNEELKEGGRSGGSGGRSHRLRRSFAASEVALSLVALVGAGLFVRSFRNAGAVDPGFEPGHVLVSRFYLSASGYTPEQRTDFCLRLRERLEAAPGIVAVSYADTIPLGFGRGAGVDVEIEGYLPAPSERMTVGRTLVAPGFFRVMGMPLLDGRDFSPRDDHEAAPTVVVNECFARRFFAGQNPIGHKVRAWGAWRTVVGLVKDAKYDSLAEPRRPYLYAPSLQTGTSADVAFFVRTARLPGGAVATLRREAAAIDPGAAAFDAMPLADYIGAPLFARRVAANLLSVLAALSLLLAAVGLYSVMAYAVAQRTQEIGVRLALGAQATDVLAMVIRQGMVLAAAGLAAGAAVALPTARLVAGLLVGVSASDPLTFVGAALFLGLVALLASYLPARRATRIDPITAIRHE